MTNLLDCYKARMFVYFNTGYRSVTVGFTVIRYFILLSSLHNKQRCYIKIFTVSTVFICFDDTLLLISITVTQLTGSNRYGYIILLNSY